MAFKDKLAIYTQQRDQKVTRRHHPIQAKFLYGDEKMAENNRTSKTPQSSGLPIIDPKDAAFTDYQIQRELKINKKR